MYEIPKCIIDATCESEVLKTDKVCSKSEKAVLHRNDEKKKKKLWIENMTECPQCSLMYRNKKSTPKSILTLIFERS